jgi:hypothetical protein
MSGRPSARIFSVAAVTAAILGIAGCYGQTDLATNVSQGGATLNARGTANNGPADVFFEYWKDSTPQTKLQTPTKTVPSGASGAFKQDVSGLADQTAYSYRLCGKDQGASGNPVCAQTHSFITGPASVQAFGETYDKSANVAAQDIYINVAAVPGAAPRGRAYYRYRNYNGNTGFPTGFAFEVGSQTEDNVTCLNVQGNVAVVGFRQVPPYPDSIPLGNQQFALVVDGGAAGSGKDTFGASLDFKASQRSPDDCSIPPAGYRGPLTRGEVSVSGTTSNPTLR